MDTEDNYNFIFTYTPPYLAGFVEIILSFVSVHYFLYFMIKAF